MSRFPVPVFFLFWLLTGLIFFPPGLGAQTYFDWALPGDQIQETEGQGLMLRSNPSGARVYIDGIEQVGRTPLYLGNLKTGQYLVQVQMEGYVERWFRANIKPGSVMDVSLELKKAVGRILLKIQPVPGSPAGDVLPIKARISVDGQSYTSGALELPVGFRNILVRAFGWEDASATVYVGEDTYAEQELHLKPAAFRLSAVGLSRSRFNPANAGSLGTTAFSFDVSAPGNGIFTVADSNGEIILSRPLGPFDTWSQSEVWDGRDSQGGILGDGIYTLSIKGASIPRDDSSITEDSLEIQVEIDSSMTIHPLTMSSGKSGLLYAPLPLLLPSGSFQIEASLLAGSPPGVGAGLGQDSGGAWTSLPFAVAARFSPMERLELSAALNVIPLFSGDAGAGVAGSAQYVFHKSGEAGLPLTAAAGAVFSWTGNTGLTPFGMASGIELFFPLKLDMGRFFSFTLTPSALWTGDEGFPWGPVPRLLVSGGLLMQATYVGAGLSFRTEYDFTGRGAWPPYTMVGAEVKLFPPPSSFVFSLMGGIWTQGNFLGGFGGLGIGMIY